MEETRMAAVGRDAVAVGKQFWQEFNDDDLMGMAGEVAYNLVLAIFPALIFLAGLAGFIGDAVGVDNLFGQILDALAQVLPPAALEIVADPILAVLTTRDSRLLSIGAIGTLWAASNATAVMMKGCNRAYGVRETRPFWLHRLLIGVGLTLVLMLLLLVAFVALALGENLIAMAAPYLGLDPGIATIWQYARWPLSVLSILIALALLYWLGPNVTHRFRLFTPGAVTVTFLWLLFTIVFQFFIVTFANFPATYGAIAGFVILLGWLYYSGLLFMLGAELNQVLGADRRAISDPPAGGPQPTAPLTAAWPAAPGATPPGFAGPPPARPASDGSGAPAWMLPATLAVWTLLILVGALRRGGRP
jgi:membrane protein